MAVSYPHEKVLAFVSSKKKEATLNFTGYKYPLGSDLSHIKKLEMTLTSVWNEQTKSFSKLSRHIPVQLSHGKDDPLWKGSFYGSPSGYYTYAITYHLED